MILSLAFLILALAVYHQQEAIIRSLFPAPPLTKHEQCIQAQKDLLSLCCGDEPSQKEKYQELGESCISDRDNGRSRYYRGCLKSSIFTSVEKYIARKEALGDPGAICGI